MIRLLLTTSLSSFGTFVPLQAPTETLLEGVSTLNLCRKNAKSAQNHEMSLMKWFKVVKSCYQNHYFEKMEKQFFRYHDCIIPACCDLGVLLWAPVAAENCQMSSIKWIKWVKSCHRNHYFIKMEKQFFRYHDGIIPASCDLEDCCGRLQFHKTAK